GGAAYTGDAWHRSPAPGLTTVPRMRDRVHVAVIGGGRAPQDVRALAEGVGAEVARRGAVVVCGGLGGVMEAACRGAKREGGATVGILPGAQRSEANRWVDVAVPTGLGEGRNLVIVRTADAVIAVSQGTRDDILRVSDARPERVHVIHNGIDTALYHATEARDALDAWLRPDAPPSPSSLQALRDRLRGLGGGIAGDSRRSLAGLGIELARLEGPDEGPWSTPEARRALEEMEAALAVPADEAARSLLGEPAPDVAPAPALRPSFDVAALAGFLDEPHAELRAEVMGLLASDPRLRPPVELDRAAHRERVLEALLVIAGRGWGSLAYPEDLGGEGAPGRAIAAFETLAFGDLSVLVKHGVHFGLFGGSVLQLGTRRHHERWLPAVASLEAPGCYAMTEVDHGSNVRDVETTAEYDADAEGFVLHTPHPGARKDWIGNAALHGKVATVFARLRVAGEDHGVHAFVVPLRDQDGAPLPGVTLEDRGPKEGLNGVDNGLIGFDRVSVDRDALLDRFGSVTEDGRYTSPIPGAGRRFFTMLGTLVAGRISIAAASVSAAKTGLTIAVRHGERRRQFGPSGEGEVPLLHYLTHQRLLLPRLGATYGLHFAVRHLVAAYDAVQTSAEPEEAARREIEVDAAGLKTFASWHCVDTLQACREACGGVGYLAANRFGALKADTDVFTTFEGANTVLLQLVSKGLLSAYRDDMGDLRLWGVVRYLAERAETRLTELNPVVTRRTDPEHLDDSEVHLAAFRYREERLLSSAARRLKSLLDDGVDSFEAMNHVQDHLVTLALAHVERVVLERFQEGVARAPAPGLSEVLGDLCGLWALSRLEAHAGWYLEAGYVEPTKSRAIRARLNARCGEVREQARFLVDAFAIPDAVLEAPAGIAGDPA
ncbi:MAG: acyl-CoA dehydrogenase family protein, partial [Gemmatimonadetes bacterium]|nr:acyl-CoA dehydrogenase family protein [Gemmatimonadota bacterium]